MDGNGRGKVVYKFGDFALDPFAQILTLRDEPVHLAHRPFEILTALIENRDRVMTRAELLDEFWEGHRVYDDALRKCIGSIRKAVGDTAKPSTTIETRYGGGYRFIADVSVSSVRNGQEAKTEAGNVASPQRPHLFRGALLAAGLILLILLTAGAYVLVPRETGAGTAENFPRSVPSVAVLPLKNLTGDAANDYFSDGVTESIITELSRGDDLKVISRGSTFSLRDKSVDPRELGQQLGVDNLLEGTVQKRGAAINVRVRLIDTRDGGIIWTSDDFERDFSSADDLQYTIACRVATQLHARLCGGSESHATKNGFAYQEYLKGRFEWNKRTAAGIRRSIEHFNRAIALDPNYALAYSGLSESYLQGIWHVPFDPQDALQKAGNMARKAVELDESMAEGHAALSGVFSLEWKWPEAEREILRAAELNPRFARTYHSMAFIHMLRGRHAESIQAIDKAAELDPANLVISTDRGNLLHAAGRTDEAFAQWNRTLTIDPNFLMGRQHRLVGYETTGNDAGAIEDHLAAMRLEGKPAAEIDMVRKVGERSGFKGIRRLEYLNLLTRIRKGEKPAPVSMATYCSLLGQVDEAFAWLEKAFAARDPQIVLIVSPQFSAIHSDPRYSELIARIGLR